MADAPDTTDLKRDYRSTVFLPKTDFPMKAGLPQKEPVIAARWKEEGLYQQVRAARAGREKFIFHDGPPYANGDIHIGHALNKTLKDMVVRTQTLLGKDAPYVPGWDCHGLPIEWKIEEQYRKKKLNKDEVPPKEFRAECRAYAQHWVDVQREQFQRLGIAGDWDNPYLTMDYQAEATIVSELFKFAESGQVYRGAKPVMWSPVEKTALAEAEIEYEDITSTQIDVGFLIIDWPNAPELGPNERTSDLVKAVIWTTTPWTIPVNQGIAYNPDITYVLIEDDTAPARYLVAKELLGAFGQRVGFAPSSRITEIAGEKLAGAVAMHPMTDLGGFFAKPRPFLPGEFVTTDQGTGLVHMAPDHGEDDFELCKANGIDPVFAVDAAGFYRADWAWLGGQGSVINAKFNAPDGPICSDLREAGALLAASADFRHSYPHSWRSKAKVIYRCTPQWFVAMDRALPNDHCAHFFQARWENEGGAVAPFARSGPTLRQIALNAIAATRFVPEKGENRIRSMVDQRPDWVLSRQRAWGVPIALFVERSTGELLVDDEVNQRIIAAFREQGVDAWDADNAAHFLGSDRNPDDYEMVGDILDVWFDSGCTHVFTLESGRWPDQRWPADLYLEGSDQHRGWFQSSLLESCGTRGRAPFNAVLTHGFTMDAKGMKMSKSLGNTISPLDLMKEHGADILRLWALSVDFTEDHRIGKEILGGVADQYRKLRNTFRYLLGALADFGDEEKVGVGAMPELERYMLHLTAELDRKLRRAVDDFDFNAYTRLLSDFANNDLSAFYFDIRKDVLYCEVNAETGVQTEKRRAYRTVLDTMFHALVRWLSPVLVFTTEEVWGTRYPDGGSVHLLEWPEIGAWTNDVLERRWFFARAIRRAVTETIEPLRRDKKIGSSLEADVWLALNQEQLDLLEGVDWPEVCISAPVNVISDIGGGARPPFPDGLSVKWYSAISEWIDVSDGDRRNAPVERLSIECVVGARKTDNHKCGRCWRYLPEVPEDGALCGRCEDVLNA